jgi:hypothetical protein
LKLGLVEKMDDAPHVNLVLKIVSVMFSLSSLQFQSFEEHLAW